MTIENYPKNHWMHRTKESRRRIKNIAAYNAAHELVQVKEEIKSLVAQEKALKEKLVKSLELGDYIEIQGHIELDSDYIVEYLELRPRRGLNRSKTLRYIGKRFGEEASLGVDENCSFSKKPIYAIYVRPFARKAESDASGDLDTDKMPFDDGLPF